MQFLAAVWQKQMKYSLCKEEPPSDARVPSSSFSLQDQDSLENVFHLMCAQESLPASDVHFF